MQGMFRYHPVDLGGGCLHHPPLTQALDRLPGIAYLPPDHGIGNDMLLPVALQGAVADVQHLAHLLVRHPLRVGFPSLGSRAFRFLFPFALRFLPVPGFLHVGGYLLDLLYEQAVGVAVLEEGIYSEIINVLLGCSGRVRSNEMICLVPHCSFSISLDFLSKLPSIALFPNFS